MATVFLAIDARHDRKVAIKVLKPEVASAVGAERFLREIRVTANLHHPHILPLHDSGEAGSRENGDWLLYYVMPYVEGESLRARLVRERQLGIEEAVRIARQVAGALDHAHRRGIVHRDLKPENILLQEGEPIVADFGIARAVIRAVDSPSITTSGVTVGTPQYMSPEQAAGETDLDGRTDIFSLGSLLYEMLAGVSPFSAPTAQAVIARVMADDPRPLTTVRRTVPRRLGAAVHRALSKVPGDRFATAADFAAALDPAVLTDTAGEPAATEAVPATGRPARRWRELALVAVAAAALGVAVWEGRRANGTLASVGVHRFELRLPGQQAGIAVQALALSPDGKTVVYVAFDGTRRLYQRRFDEDGAHPIAGTEGAFAPAISSDGRSVAFLTGHELKKVDLAGGAPVLIADVGSLGVTPTMSWSGDVIAYELGRFPRTVLYRVSARNGGPQVLVDSGGGASYTTPEVLPGGDAVLYTAWGSAERGVYVVSVRTRQAKLLVPDAMSPRYVAGHLLYATPEGAVFRRPFDPSSLSFTGEAAPVLAGVSLVSRNAQLVVSESGTLLYLPDSLGSNGLALISHDGAVTPLPLTALGAPRQRYVSLPRFSPDGGRIVVPLQSNPSLLDSTALWVYDIRQPTFTRVVAGQLASASSFRYVADPEWTPDGRRISFVAYGAAGAGLFVENGDGSGTPVLLAGGRDVLQNHSWAPDGRWVVARRGDLPETLGGRTFDLVRIDVGGGGAQGGAARRQTVVATSADERQPAVSPDSRWLAYVSNESGPYEVYVRGLDSLGHRSQISAGGGLEPRWSHDGKELFYRRGEALGSVPVQIKPSFAVRGPRRDLFRMADPSSIFGPNYDVEPNGRGFVSRWRTDPDMVLVVLDWFSEWRNVPTAR
jgi:eukaryotic-like serine/threonine-protein kinase